MNIVIANLYKRFQADGQQSLEDNTFSLIGHFDYLQFKIVPYKSLSEQYTDREEQKRIHPAWTGFDSQSLYLFSSMDMDKPRVESLISSSADTLPFCVMATIEDSEKFNIEAPPFDSQDVQNRLAKYRQKYVDAFNEFMRTKGRQTGYEAELEVFFTLSCIDTVLLFRTNSFTLIHDFIYDLYMPGTRLMSYTMYGVRAGFLFRAHEGPIEPDDNLCLSMRVSYNPNMSFNAIKDMDAVVTNLTSNQSVSSIPAGRYHCLYYITQGVYKVLDACLNPDGELALNSEKNKSKAYVNGYRFTLSFQKDLQLSNNLHDNVTNQDDNEAKKNHDDGTNQDDNERIDETTHSVYDAFKALNRDWEQSSATFSEADSVILMDLKSYAVTVENNVREYMYFFARMDSHTRHMINDELRIAITEPLHKLKQIIQDFEEYIPNLLKKDVDDAVIKYEIFLDQMQTVISEFGAQIGDLIHMQQNRLEDRGVYHNDVAATAKLSLGYYSYAKLVSDALFLTDQSDATHSDENPFSFYINLESTCDRVNATEHFNIVLNYQHQHELPTKGALVGIDISRQRISDIHYVKVAITHEIAHFVGWRNRAFRAECIINSVCKMMARILIPDLHLKEGEDPILKVFYNDREKALKDTIESIRIEFVERIGKGIREVFRLRFKNDLKWAFQINCEDLLKLILQCWFGSPDTDIEYGSIIMNNYIDIPVLVANLNVDLHERWSEIAFNWIRESGKRPGDVMKSMFDFFASPVQLLNSAVTETKKRIDVLMGGTVQWPQCFYNMQYDKENERLKERTRDVADEHLALNSRSLYGIIHDICDTYSEAYCDLAMVKLLNLSAGQYMDYLYREGQMDSPDCLRMWSVLRAAYKKSSITIEDTPRVEKIQKGAGSYLLCEDDMKAYLTSIMSNPDMQKLFEHEAGYFIPSSGKTEEENDNLLHLYACYLQLHA